MVEKMEKRICIRLPPSLYSIINEISANTGLTASEITRIAIERYLISVRDFMPDNIKSLIDSYFSPLSKS